jgi:uncharacterized protein (DUF2236 family)
MIAQDSGIGMEVGRFSRPMIGVGVIAVLDVGLNTMREVGVLAMPDAGLDTTLCVESGCVIPLGAGVLQLIVPGVVVGVLIDRCCVADGVEVTHSVVSATRELFSEDEGVEF